jgi:hypothetical protein
MPPDSLEDEHKVLQWPAAPQRAAEVIPGPWAPISLLHMTDSRLGDSEKVLLAVISVRSVKHGYTFASWATIAADMGKSLRRVEQLAARLIRLGLVRTEADKALKADKKWVVAASDVYGHAQLFGWKLLEADRDDLDLKILRTEIPPTEINDGSIREKFRVGPKQASGRPVANFGQMKRKERKEFNEKEIKDCPASPAAAPTGDLPTQDQKIADDNQDRIDDVLVQEQMTKVDENTRDSINPSETQGEGTSVVDQKKKLVDERAERLRNLSRQTMEQTDAKSRAKAAKAEEKRRRREEAGGSVERRSSYQEQKDAAGVVNAGNVRSWWDEAYRDSFNGRPNPRWTKQEMVLVKRMLEDFGPELVEEGVRDFISSWESKWSRKYKAEGLPEISLLYYKRSEVLGKISRNDSSPANKKPEPKFF